MNKKSFLIIFLTVFMDLVGFGIVIPLNPYLAREFGATPVQVGLLMAVFSLFQFIFSPIWGQISDRVGRRPVILVSVLGASLAHLWFSMASGLTGLFAARILAGLFGGNISTAMAAMADITSPQERSKGMGLVGAAFGLGFILGPFLGGVMGGLGHHLGSSPPFGSSFPALVAAVICFGNFVLAWFIFPETRDLKLVQEAQLAPQKSAQPEKKPAEKVQRLGLIFNLLRQPVVGSLLWVYFLTTLAMANMEASLFMMVQDRFHWSIKTASWGFAYVGVIIAFTQGGLIRKTLPLWGEAKSFLFGLMGMAIGFSGIAMASHPMGLGLAVTFLALGNGLANPALTGSISLLTSSDRQGGMMGISQSLSALARIFGPVMGGWSYQVWGSSMPFWLAAAFILGAWTIGWKVRSQVPRAAVQSAAKS